jgi:hypothetical protein
MWVAGSHRFMQSANVSPPPPGRESALAVPPVDTLFCVGGVVDAMEGFTSDGAGAVEVGGAGTVLVEDVDSPPVADGSGIVTELVELDDEG